MDENKELLTILEVKENNFEMNKDVDISKLNGSQLRLGIISALGYQEGSNEVRMLASVYSSTKRKRFCLLSRLHARLS